MTRERPEPKKMGFDVETWAPTNRAPEAAAIELLARLEEADGNKAGAFTLRSTGAVGTHFANKLNIVLAAMRSSLPNPEGMTEALRDAREAIASLDEFALGGVDIPDTHTGESVGQYGVRDELLAKIDAALSPNPDRQSDRRGG